MALSPALARLISWHSQPQIVMSIRRFELGLAYFSLSKFGLTLKRGDDYTHP
jgi:hypothetical protein